MKSSLRTAKVGTNRIYIIRSYRKPQFSNYLNRINFFWKLNRLDKNPYFSHEQKRKLIIGCSLHDISLLNKVNRIVKLIAWRKKHSVEIISGYFDIDTIIKEIGAK